MDKALIDELLNIKAANATLIAANAEAAQHRDNPSWILEDIELPRRTGYSEKFHEREQREHTKKLLSRFYDEKRSSRNHEEDEAYIKAVEAREQAVEELDQSEARWREIREGFEQAKASTGLAREEEAKKLDTVQSSESRVHNLKAKLEQERNDGQERIEKAEAESKEKKATAEKDAKAAAEKQITDAEDSIVMRKASAGSIIKWLFIGLIAASIATSIASGLFMVILGDNPIVFVLGNLVGLVVLFLPLAKYMSDIRKENKEAQEKIESARREGAQKIQAAESMDFSTMLEDMRQSQSDKLETLERDLANAQEQLDKNIEEVQPEQKKVKELKAIQDQQEARLRDAEKEYDELKEKVLSADKDVNDAFKEFIFSLEDEFLAAREEERKRHESTLAQLEENARAAQKAFERALTLQSAGAVYNPSDLGAIDRVIEKLQTNRASTLSEALNAVDADQRAERMHAEQMAATRRHNEQIAAQERKKAAELAQIEREKAEALKQQALDAAEAERERNRILAEKTHAELEIQEKQAAAEQAASDEMLRLQQEATAAAEAAAEAEAQRLQEEQDYYYRAEQESALRQQEYIESNLRKCSSCIHRPAYSSGITEKGFCYAGGCYYGESATCIKYEVWI